MWCLNEIWTLQGVGKERRHQIGNQQRPFQSFALPTNALNITFTAKQRWIEPFHSHQACAGSIQDRAFLNIICPCLFPLHFDSQGHSCFCTASVEYLCSSFWGRKNSTTPVSFYSSSLVSTWSQTTCLTTNMGLLRCDKISKRKQKVHTQNKAKSMESALRSQVLLGMEPTPECGW